MRHWRKAISILLCWTQFGNNLILSLLLDLDIMYNLCQYLYTVFLQWQTVFSEATERQDVTYLDIFIWYLIWQTRTSPILYYNRLLKEQQIFTSEKAQPELLFVSFLCWIIINHSYCWLIVDHRSIQNTEGFCYTDMKQIKAVNPHILAAATSKCLPCLLDKYTIYPLWKRLGLTFLIQL